MAVRIGTRKSLLALWQAEHVAELLEREGLESVLVPMETKGDKILDVAIQKIGSKGVFTEEIENALKSDSIDIAVHSAKDMQSILPEGFELIAFTKREDPCDVLVSRREDASLEDKTKTLIVGSSSVRRVALLKHFYPHIKVVDMRGNLQTRIRKMDEGECQALMLAFAGVHRMGYTELIREKLSTQLFTPPAGQGSIAIEAHERLDKELKEKIRRAVNHQETELLMLAERSYLKELEGGCSIPAFALASLDKEGRIKLRAGIAELDGSKVISEEALADKKEAETVGKKLAEIILSKGGKKILDEIKERKSG